jgi:hypothetical protein
VLPARPFRIEDRGLSLFLCEYAGGSSVYVVAESARVAQQAAESCRARAARDEIIVERVFHVQGGCLVALPSRRECVRG